jgi:parvulin-like peptidyl-prolyl isomerase
MLTANHHKICLQDLIGEVKLSIKIPELIHNVFRRKIISRSAHKFGIKPTDEELQTAADFFRSANQLKTVELTQKWLRSHFLSLEEFEQIVADRLINEKLAHHLFAEKVEHFFCQNLLEYGGATIYEVVLEDKELAIEIFYSLEEGDLSFADVARKYITDPELKRRGGYLGTLNRKQLRPEISAAVFAAQPPQLIKPVITDVGVHLIHVEEIIQPQLDRLLHHQIMMDMFERWIEQQIEIVSPQISIEF